MRHSASAGWRRSSLNLAPSPIAPHTTTGSTRTNSPPRRPRPPRPKPPPPPKRPASRRKARATRCSWQTCAPRRRSREERNSRRSSAERAYAAPGVASSFGGYPCSRRLPLEPTEDVVRALVAKRYRAGYVVPAAALGLGHAEPVAYGRELLVGRPSTLTLHPPAVVGVVAVYEVYQHRLVGLLSAMTHGQRPHGEGDELVLGAELLVERDVVGTPVPDIGGVARHHPRRWIYGIVGDMIVKLASPDKEVVGAAC